MPTGSPRGPRRRAEGVAQPVRQLLRGPPPRRLPAARGRGGRHPLRQRGRDHRALYEVDSFDAAGEKVRGHCEIACLTRGPQGSVIVTADAAHEVPAHPVERVVDTTAAGDLYAAGFLYGYTQGMAHDRAGRLGSIAASAVIGHTGARPGMSLEQLLTALDT